MISYDRYHIDERSTYKDMIIDFHTHTFPKSISLKALESLSINGHVKYFTDGTVEKLEAGMKEYGVDYSVNLPVMTKESQVSSVNDNLIRQKDELFEKGIITFGGLHPLFENYRDEIKKLAAAGIKGIKLHPAFQGMQINDIAYKRVIAAISEAGMVTITHCGLDVGFMDHNYATVKELIDLIDDVKPEKLVLAHMGGWQAWDEVCSDLAGAKVWLDTAYSLGPVNPRPGDEEKMLLKYNLDEAGFTKIVRKHGAENIVFATDSPWAMQGEYISFVNNTELTDEEKNCIFSKNAMKLLGI